MSRRLAVASLATVHALTLLCGTAAALTLSAAPPAQAPPVAVPAPEPRIVAAHVVAPKPVVIRPVVAHKATPARHRTVRRHVQVRPRRTRVVRVVHVLSPQARMMQAIARIPGYHTGDATWAITPGLGHWGLADLNSGVIYISPAVPSNRMYDVVSHEWSHVLSMKVYGGDVTTALNDLNNWYGGSDLMGAERAADCMARQLGATWTHYTPCDNAHWRDGARRLLAHQRLS